MKKGPKKTEVNTKLLFETIRDAKSENAALDLLREQLKDTPTLSSLRPWRNRTVLSAAAVQGYEEVLQYLIEEKKANPNELFDYSNKKITPLEVAIINNKINSALYLADKLKNFIIDPRTGECLALTFAIELNYLEIVKKILTRDPNLRYKVNRNTKNTLLHKALLTPFDDIVLYLLQNGASSDILTANNEGVSPYFLALNGAREKVLELMLELGAHPLSCPYLNKDIDPLTIVLAYMGKQSKVTIPKCINHLLTAGAGLDISSLPEELFAFYNLQDKKHSLGPLLVLAKQRQPNGIWKSRLITRMDDLRRYWRHPDWQFNEKQLALAVCYPKLKAAHISDLHELILMETAVSLPVNELPNLDSFTVEEIKNLNVNQLIKHMAAHWSFFVEKATIFKDALNQACSPQDEISRTLGAMQNYFKKLSAIMIFLNHPDVSLVSLKHGKGDNSSNLVTLLHHEFLFLMELHILSNQFHLPNFLMLFYEQLALITKKHRFILTNPEYLSAHNALKLAQMNAACYLAQMNSKNSSTLHWALEANAIVDDMRDYGSSLWQEPKVNAMFVLAMAYVYLGWNKEAHNSLKKAFNLLKFTYRSTCIIRCIENIVATLDATLHHTEEAIKILAQCCIILEAYQKELLKIFNSGTSIDLMLLNAKKTLIKIQRLYFIQNPLLADFKQLGMLLDASWDPDILFILDQDKIPLDHELINLCLNTLPSSIQYDPARKALFFKLDLLPMRNITWLKNLLIDIKQSTEKALIQDFSNLTIEPTPSKPKVKIKTRPQQDICEVNSESESKSEPESEEENYGFNLVPGYSPPVPILCKNKYIPDETLFISIPTNDPTFLPFLNLIRDKESGKYHGIYCIDPKGPNQQGVKFLKGMEMARLKALGTHGKGKLRPTGSVCQEYTTKDGRTRKLYCINEDGDKKSEKRKNLLN